jgi:glutamate-1-semialdehyde 2,1-aminomutase
MEHLAPLGPVYQAGTLSGNPVATAAGLAVLSLLDDAAYGALRERAQTLETRLREVFAASGSKVDVVRVETLTGLFFGVEQVRDYADAQAADHAAYARFFHAMLDRGVFLPPSGYEAMFVSLAHDDAALGTVVDAATHSVSAS